MKISLFVRSVVLKNQKGSFQFLAPVRQAVLHLHHVPRLEDFPEHKEMSNRLFE